jgi:hypothetical protein
MMDLKRFIGQLLQRRVFRAASMYLAAVWVLLQVADTLAGDGIIPEPWVQVLILTGAVGLPFVLLGSWYLEAPWKAGGRVGTAGDIFIILAITAGVFLFARQQWFANVEPIDVAVGRIEATDLQPATQQIADHLQERFAELLDATDDADLQLSGTLARGGEVLRLTMRLTDASGALLWSETFEEALVDIGDLQQRLVASLASDVASIQNRYTHTKYVLRACPYPGSSDAILALVSDEAPESLTPHIESNADNGLLLLERSLRWYGDIGAAPARERPVLFSLATDSLDKAAAACPDYRRIDDIRVAYTQLQAM